MVVARVGRALRGGAQFEHAGRVAGGAVVEDLAQPCNPGCIELVEPGSGGCSDEAVDHFGATEAEGMLGGDEQAVSADLVVGGELG